MDNSLWQGPQIEQQRNSNQNHPLISKLLDFTRKYIKKKRERDEQIYYTQRSTKDWIIPIGEASYSLRTTLPS